MKLCDFENWVLKHETDKALLVAEELDSDSEFWIPKSVAEVTEQRRHRIDFTVPEWFAQKEGMI